MTRKMPGIAKVTDVTLKRGVLDASETHDRFANADTGYLLGETRPGAHDSAPDVTPEFTDFNTIDSGITSQSDEFVIFTIGHKTADGSAPTQPFGHTIGIGHEHQPPVNSVVASGPKLIILDEPASDDVPPADDFWL